MIRLVCIVIGYLFGMFQTAFFLGKLKGIDIREHGSGNAGTTNTLRVLGTKAGAIVFVGDMLKSILSILLVRLVFRKMYPDIMPLLVIYTGAGCVLGHNFPFYLKFKGGKGIAASGGMILSFHPWCIPVGLLLFFGNFFITHIVSIGSLLLYVGFLVQTIIMGQSGVLGLTQAALIELYIVIFLLTCLAFYMHRENIKRLIHGNERKTYLLKKNKMDIETNKDAEKYVSDPKEGK
ncbi:MAG: glycerol-3-phosphate 1-O-acyltransferase PlsY [Lachnospiraceae bacterium]|nr:glycerol-3-phosphate 1-O-acyltransferase PlsY [Lachnospiraceae bacterium]